MEFYCTVSVWKKNLLISEGACAGNNGTGKSHRICRVPVQTEPAVVVTTHKKGAIALPCLKLLNYKVW